MKYFIPIFLSLATALAVAASFKGWGLPEPVKEPVSIREGSAPGTHHGYHGPRYFIGGGYVGGK